jgi:peroxiredoxin Q/BCP
MLNKGDQAPAFEGTDQTGNTLQLAELLSNGPVLLYFYPADFTPICTAQACAFRDRQDALTNASLQIVGVSPQSESSHQRFAETYDLGFPLIPDQNKRIIKAYGVDGPFGIGVRRATYLIGADGLIRDRVVSDLFVGSHTEFIRSAIENIDADGARG